jgi:hypothetical protein
MSWQLQARAAFERSRVALSLLRPGRLSSILCLGGVIQGCEATPISPSIPDPTDASVRVPTVSYRSAVGPFSSQRPVEPGPWEEPTSQAPGLGHQQ